MSEEIEVLRALKPHQHVIKFIEGGQKLYITEVAGKMTKAVKVHYIVMELAEKVDLIDFLTVGASGFTE